MKKFNLVASLAAIVFGVNAQNVAITSSVTEGDIENGATIEVPWEIGFEMEGMTMFKWDPHFTVRSLTGENEEITVYATSSVTAQLCWPSNCQAITPNNTVSATGTVNGSGSDIQFDRSDWDYEGGSTPSDTNYGTGSLRVVDSEGNEILINIIWTTPNRPTVENRIAITSSVTEGDIKDGATVEVPWEIGFQQEGMTMFEWNPHFTVRSLTGEDEEITVYATSSVTAQLCWPSNCQAITPNNTVSATGTVNGSGSDIQFDRSDWDYEGGSTPSDTNYGTGSLRVVDSEGNETLINIVWIAPESSSKENNRIAITSTLTNGDIENGTTVEVPWEIGFQQEGMTMFEWNPHFTVRSLTGEDEEVTVYATSSVTAQLCWPSNCQAITPNNTVSATGTVNGSGSDIQFDRSDWDYEGSTIPNENNYGTGSLRVVDSEGNEILINIIWVAPKEGTGKNRIAITSSVTEGDIENGATVEVPWEIGFEMEGMTMFEWNPHFTVRSLTGVKEEITVYATSSVPAQLCWPSNCHAIMEGKEVSATGTVDGNGSDIQFDRSDWSYDGEKTPSESNYGIGSLKVVDSDGVEHVVNIIWTLESEINVGFDNINTDAPAEYYSLTGVRVNNPSKGIYIVKRGNKVTREVVR